MDSIGVESVSDFLFDVVIIGAGVAGINAAYRIQTALPGCKYVILESRGAIGGTWDFFRYPGIRSDSDLHTFGFPWRPWTAPQTIADGASIRQYIIDCAEEHGIDRKIEFQHKVTAADWSSNDQYWTLAVDNHARKISMMTRFIIFSTGFFDYQEPLQASIPGLANFRGQVIHPQFWPEGQDYTDKKIVVIGSGATAITLVPALAQKAAKVTMLQRSPTYVVSQPTIDPFSNMARTVLPNWMAYKLIRWKFLVMMFFIYQFCRVFPNSARALIRREAENQLPKNIPHDPHFRPFYNPWDQRLCTCPDGDFFTALRDGTADVITDTIKTISETGIETSLGKILDADIIVTATGLKMLLLGGVAPTIDSEPFTVADKYVWKGQLVQDLPNAAFVVGHINVAWTVGCDATAMNVCRLLAHMGRNGLAVAIPRVPEGLQMKPRHIIDLSSTYFQTAKSLFPRAGDQGPWKPRTNHLTDTWEASYGSVTTGIEFIKAGKKDS